MDRKWGKQGPAGIHERELEPTSVLTAYRLDIMGVPQEEHVCGLRHGAKQTPDPGVGEDTGRAKANGVSLEFPYPRVSYRPGHCPTSVKRASR